MRGKTKQKTKFMVSMEGMATDGYERRRKRKSSWRCWRIKGAEMTIYLTRISLIKFTLLHPWRNQHQQSTGLTWKINERLNIHKKLEHRNIRTWSNPKCNWIFRNAPQLNRHQMNPKYAMQLDFGKRPPPTKSPPNEPKNKGGKVWILKLKNGHQKNSISFPLSS